MVAFNMARQMGEELAAQIIQDCESQPDRPICIELTKLVHQRGLGHATILSKETFEEEIVKIPMVDPPTTASQGSFVLFLAGFWSGVAKKICGKEFSFLRAVPSGNTLTLYLKGNENPENRSSD